MTAYLLANHILNFMAPALVVALVLVGLARPFSRFYGSKVALVKGWWAQVIIIFLMNLAVLVAGLLIFGHDGKMLTYAAMVFGAAFCQWVLLQGWKA